MARLPYPDGYFDAVLDVVACATAASMKRSDNYAELARVTKPGGRLFSRTFARGCWGEGTGTQVGRDMWLCGEGHLKGYGATRFTGEDRRSRRWWQVGQVDRIERSSLTEEESQARDQPLADLREQAVTRGGHETIATICARGGSKGLPRKNVLPFAGKP